MSKRDRAWLNRAVAIAHRSTATKRHGCIVVRGGAVLGVGFNKYTSEAVHASPEHFHKCSVHAEAAALRGIKNAKGATIYIARINNGGEERFSAPCSNCQVELDKAGISKVVYTVWT